MIRGEIKKPFETTAWIFFTWEDFWPNSQEESKPELAQLPCWAFGYENPQPFFGHAWYPRHSENRFQLIPWHAPEKATAFKSSQILGSMIL